MRASPLVAAKDTAASLVPHREKPLQPADPATDAERGYEVWESSLGDDLTMTIVNHAPGVPWLRDLEPHELMALIEDSMRRSLSPDEFHNFVEHRG